MMRPPNLRRYCTPRRPGYFAIPSGHIYTTTAEYIAAFIHLNFLIP